MSYSEQNNLSPFVKVIDDSPPPATIPEKSNSTIKNYFKSSRADPEIKRTRYSNKSIGTVGIEKFVHKIVETSDLRSQTERKRLINGSQASTSLAPPRSISSQKNNNLFEIYEKAKNTFSKICAGRFIVHTVLHFNEPEDINTYPKIIHSKILKNKGKFAFVTLSIHYEDKEDGDHLHILHDCACTNKSCQCAPFLILNIKDKVTRIYDDMNGENLGKLTLHLSSGSMFMCNYFLDPWRSISPDEVQEKRLLFNVNSGSPDGTPCHSIPKESKNCEKIQVRMISHLPEEIYTYMKNYLVTPVENITQTSLWLENESQKITSLTSRSHILRKAFILYKKYLCSLTLGQLFHIHRSPTITKVYSALGSYVWDYYLSEVESTRVLKSFLILQSKENNLDPKSFLEPIYQILNKSHVDTNCLILSGPGGSGKTWLSTIVAELLINYVFIESNPTGGYCFSEGVNRNLIVLDDFSWNKFFSNKSKSILTLQKICMGETVSVIVGKKFTEVVTKTPVIICLRDYPDRVPLKSSLLNLSVLDFPRYLLERKLHPLALANLFVEYGICQRSFFIY